MQTEAIFLGLAALGGLTMLAMRLKGTPRPPTWMALGHGAIAAIGLGLLIYAAMSQPIPGVAQLALALFGLAAIGGASLFVGFQLKERPLPIPLVIGHGLTALTALVLLLFGLYRH